MFLLLTTTFSLLAAACFATVHLLNGAYLPAAAPLGVIAVVLGCWVWASQTGSVRSPTRVIAITILVVLSVQTLRQGEGIHGAGWWLSTLPFVLAAGGYHRLAGASLAVFIGIVGVIYLAPGLNPFQGQYMQVSPGLQLASILGSEAVAVALIWVSMRRRSNITKAIDRARSEAIGAAAFKARFLANMSHEIRTPLLGLIGAIELLRSNNTSLSQRKQLVSLADASAHTLHTLINDILDFSKLESGDIHLEEAPFNLRELCFQVNELFAIKAFDKGLELTSTCDPAVPMRFLGDAARIKQLVSNLVSNAVKFTEKGEVHIHIGLDEEDGGGWATSDTACVRIEVSDTGIGISEEDVKKLFRPFIQADSSITRRFGGTGLGLSISAELARVMGGHLDVKSNPGAGSSFTFTLPLLIAGQPETAKREANHSSHSKVAIASASQGLRRHIGSLLHDLGRPHVAFESRPTSESLAGLHTLVLDSALLAGEQNPGDIVGAYASGGCHVILLQPIGSDSIVGLFGTHSNVSIVHKPVRLGTLRRSLEPLGRLNRAVSAAAERLGASPAEAAAAPDKRYATLRILVAEDNPVNQVIITAMLTELGATCTMTSNGAEAVDAYQLAGAGFDIVLMDLQMPVMDGLHASEAIRSLEGTDRTVPIIAMTANTERDMQTERDKAQMTGYLGKPFRVSELRACLDQWCAERNVDAP